MNSKIKKNKDNEFNQPSLSIDKVADADTVIGKSIKIGRASCRDRV